MTSLKKSLVVILAIAIIAPLAPIAVPRAHAQLAVGEVWSVPKVLDDVLKHAAFIAARTALQSMTRSIVNWINTGFQGSPAFATNLGVNLQQLADGTALDFFNQLEQDEAVSSPYISNIAGVLREAYLLSSNPQAALEASLRYTLHDVTQNDLAFRNGAFNQGGFNAWAAVTFQCGNDPYCARLAAQDELNKQVGGAVQQRITELGWGNGFMSWRGNCGQSSSQTTSLSKVDNTGKCDVRTPGTVLAGQMTFLANQPQLQLTVADSIDQILSALLNQALVQITGPNGLLGSGGSSGSSGLGPALQQSTNGQVGATLSSAFIQSTQDQLNTVTLYKNGWQKIKDAANQAAQFCAILGSSANKTQVQQVNAQADAAIAKANTAIAALNSMIAKAQQAQGLTGSDQSALVQKVNDDYECLLSGGAPTDTACTPPAATEPIGITCPVSPRVLPDGSELSCILTQSQDDNGSGNVTLLKQMKQLAASCI